MKMPITAAVFSIIAIFIFIGIRLAMQSIDCVASKCKVTIEKSVTCDKNQCKL